MANSQNRWEFPMIFTDKFGVSDTVWFIQREDSKLENNTINVTEERYCLDDEGFQVYFRRTGDTLWKSKTHLFTNDFEWEGIYATRLNFPITISWNGRMFDTIIGSDPPISFAKIENSYTGEHDLEGNLIYDYYGWYVLGLNTTGPQPPYDENDLQNWNWFYGMYADYFFPLGITLRRHYSDVPENNDETNLYSVYPNPVNDCIRIELSDNASCQSVSIYSIDGRLVETFPETSHQTTIDISGLTTGIYIMKVRLSDGREYAERIIKE